MSEPLSTARPTRGLGRVRASKLKRKTVYAKCPTCAGAGEIATEAHHAMRCPACQGSGLALQSENRQLIAFVWGKEPRRS